jgi:hypothetical protein
MKPREKLKLRKKREIYLCLKLHVRKTVMHCADCVQATEVKAIATCHMSGNALHRPKLISVTCSSRLQTRTRKQKAARGKSTFNANNI